MDATNGILPGTTAVVLFIHPPQQRRRILIDSTIFSDTWEASSLVRVIDERLSEISHTNSSVVLSGGIILRTDLGAKTVRKCKCSDVWVDESDPADLCP